MQNTRNPRRRRVWETRWFKENDVTKKTTTAILLILAVAMVLFFTFQDAEGTTSLSETVRHWLEGYGIKAESHALRSNIHILEYFIVGLAVLAFGASRGWTVVISVIVCAGIALLDESIKVLLPTREFDVIDLIKDWVGVAVALLVIQIIGKRKPITFENNSLEAEKE